MGEYERKAPCVVINCGDDHGGDHGDKPGKDYKKRDCCEPCEATKQGDAYVGGVDLGYLAPVATELPAALLVNPAGSGKKIYIYKRNLSSVGSDDENVLFKFYFNPVVTQPGVLSPIVNLNQSGVPKVSAAQLYSQPVLSSMGTLIDAFNSPSDSFESDTVIIIGEGNALLVTERANAENSRAAAFLYFTECEKKHWPHEPPTGGDEG